MPVDFLGKKEKEERDLFEEKKESKQVIEAEMTSAEYERQIAKKIAKPKFWQFWKKQENSADEKINDSKDSIGQKPDKKEAVERVSSDKDIKQTIEQTKESKPEQESKQEKIDDIKPFLESGSSKDNESKGKGAFDISLITEETVLIPRVIRSRFLFLTSFLVIIFTIFSLTWLYADWYFEKMAIKSHRIQGEIQLMEARSFSYLDLRDEISLLEKRADLVNNILKNHIYWTKFFSLLEKYTVADVYFGNFSADISGNIHLSATAKDLMSMAKQIVSFSNAPDFIVSSEVAGLKKLPNGVSASFDLFLKDNVFYK